MLFVFIRGNIPPSHARVRALTHISRLEADTIWAQKRHWEVLNAPCQAPVAEPAPRRKFAARLALLALCVLGPIGAACAQSTTAMPMEALPLVHVRAGAVQGCGVRLTGGEPNRAVSSWFDVSFNVFRRGFGLAQSIAYELKRSEYDGESRPARVPVQSTWLTASEESARLGENTERRESLVYMLVIDDVLALFEAVASGRPVTLGIRRWGQRVDAVYTGTPVLSADSRHQISTCLAGLALE